jgi:probable F420-dependent oxidoreductase
MKIGWFGIGSGLLADKAGVDAVAQAAEDLGFESLWVGEHPVLIDPRESPSPLPPHTPLLDPVAVLSYLACCTSRIQLGTGIVILPLRNPVILAKQMATADVLSNGRVILGVGVGYVPGEYAAIGVDFTTRGRRADEYIDALRSLWNDDQPHCHGDFTSVSGIQCRPQPARAGGVPIVASGTATRALRRAVTRADGWYGFFVSLEACERLLGQIHQLSEHEERPARLGSLEITVTPPGGTISPDDVARYEALGVDRLVVMRDFADMGGRPEPAVATVVIAAMQGVANDLGLRP